MEEVKNNINVFSHNLSPERFFQTPLKSYKNTYLYTDQVYSQDAFLPDFDQKKPWVTQDEYHADLCKVSNIFQYNSIAVVKLPETVYSPMVSCCKMLNLKPNETVDFCKFEVSLENFYHYLADLQYESELDYLSLVCKLPKLHTVTYNPVEKEFIGMHLDFWDKKTHGKQLFAKNRLMINLGEESRHFLWVNHLYHDIEAWYLKKRQVLSEITCPTDVAKHYMREYLPYVIAVSVHPGEALITPTDNLIHDATTYDKTTNDYSLHFLGNFDIPMFLKSGYRYLPN